MNTYIVYPDGKKYLRKFIAAETDKDAFFRFREKDKKRYEYVKIIKQTLK
jgi:hypothetical protein